MRIAGVLLLLWCVTLPCLAQTNATKDPTALTALAQMVAATGWNPATLPVDATATATVTTYEGDTQNTQSITIQVKGLREILVQSSAGSSVVNNDQAAYTDEKGPHLLASYSAMSIQAIELPFLTSLMNFNASNVSVQSLGTDTVNGQATEKVLISPQPFPNDSIGQLRAKAWTMTIWIASSGLPVQLAYTRIPETNSAASLTCTRQFSGWQRVGGIEIPFAQDDYCGSRHNFTIQLQSVQLNTGLADGIFTVPTVQQ